MVVFRSLLAFRGPLGVIVRVSPESSRRLPSSLDIDGRSFRVLGPMESTKWLGRKVSFHDPHEQELSNRIAAAWGAFTKHKEELTSRRFRWGDRLKLFNAVVSSTVLYGCETWTLRIDQQRRLRTVQRRMLRMVLNTKRARLVVVTSESSLSGDEEDIEEIDTLEPWPEFLKRTAVWTEEQLKKARQGEWLDSWRKRQWIWACKLVSADAEKWSAIATTWQPLLHSSCPRGRAQARPKKRWDEDIVSFVRHTLPDNHGDWSTQAKNKDEWMKHVDKFAKYCSGNISRLGSSSS